VLNCGMCAVIPDAGKSSTVAPRRDDQLNCNAVDCDDVEPLAVPDCPADSRPAPLRLTRGSIDDADDAGLCCEGQTAPR